MTEEAAAAEEVARLYKELGSIDAVAKQTGLSRRQISQTVRDIPNREAYRRRGTYSTIPPENILQGLQTAAGELGEPLSGLRYQEIAPKLGLPAFNTVVRRFGSWQQACKEAGVKCNPPRGKRDGAFTREDCVEAVTQCIKDFGGVRPSYDEYREWAADTEFPSGPTVRNLVGWNQAVEEALNV